MAFPSHLFSFFPLTHQTNAFLVQLTRNPLRSLPKLEKQTNISTHSPHKHDDPSGAAVLSSRIKLHLMDALLAHCCCSGSAHSTSASAGERGERRDARSCREPYKRSWRALFQTVTGSRLWGSPRERRRRPHVRTAETRTDRDTASSCSLRKFFFRSSSTCNAESCNFLTPEVTTRATEHAAERDRVSSAGAWGAV